LAWKAAPDNNVKTAELKDCYCQKRSSVINWRANDVTQRRPGCIQTTKNACSLPKPA